MVCALSTIGLGVQYLDTGGTDKNSEAVRLNELRKAYFFAHEIPPKVCVPNF